MILAEDTQASDAGAGRRRHDGPLGGARPGDTVNQTIIIADDSPNVRRLLRTVLTRAGYETVEASTGPAALELVRRLRPAVLLVDVELPLLDGFEVCRELQFEPFRSDLRIVVLTAHDDARARARALEAGADAYLAKPFRTIRLLATIAELLHRHRGFPRAAGAGGVNGAV